MRPDPIRRSSRPALRALALALALVLAGTAAACGGDDGGGATTSLPSAGGSEDGRTTGTTAPSPQDQAVAAYQDGQAYLSHLLAARPPDPLDPGLEDYFSGDALSGSRDVVAALLSANQYADSTVTTDPEVVDASGDTVVLDDCLREQVTRYDNSSGAQADAGTSSYNMHVTVRATDGAWRVDQIEIREEPCTP